MKRLVKMWNMFDKDSPKFSNSSTHYEMLPAVVADWAGDAQLKLLAEKHGVEVAGRFATIETDSYNSRSIRVTNAMRLKTDHTRKTHHGETENHTQWLAFVTIPNGCLEVKATVDNKLSKQQCQDIVNGNGYVYGIEDVAKMIDGKTVVIMSGWSYFHGIKLSGYSPESFRDNFGIDSDDEYFHDSVTRCGECNLYDHESDGYTYNYRIVNECDLLGINCGCYAEYMGSPEALESFVNESKQCIEADVMESHAEKGRARKLETYIGGMTDGRGGYINGKAVSDGNPKDVLADWLSKFPKGRFVFSRDDSGQFQTYFSIWELLPEKKKAKKSKAKGIVK